MPFDNPYFPTQFDVGDVNGGHTHFDNTGIYEYNPANQLVAQLTPAGLRVMNPDGSYIALSTTAPASMTLNQGAPQPAGFTMFNDGAPGNARQYAVQIQSPFYGATAVLTLGGDSVDGTKRPAAALVAEKVIFTGTLTGKQLTWDGSIFNVDSAAPTAMKVKGQIESIGNNAGLIFDDRALNENWVWYAVADGSGHSAARLWSSYVGSDVLQVGPFGAAFLRGSFASNGDPGAFGSLFSADMRNASANAYGVYITLKNVGPQTPFVVANASGAIITGIDYSGGFYPSKFGLASTAGALWGGSGAPPNANGSNGDFYFRIDTPATANQRIYIKSAGAWVGIL